MSSKLADICKEEIIIHLFHTINGYFQLQTYPSKFNISKVYPNYKIKLTNLFIAIVPFYLTLKFSKIIKIALKRLFGSPSVQ